MAISITAANVKPSANAHRLENVDESPTVSAVAFTAGQVAARQATGVKFGLCDCNDASDIVATPVGVFENSGGADQVCSIVDDDPELDLGAGVLTTGKILVPGATPGAMNVSADGTTGWKTSTLGICMSDRLLALHLSPLASPAIA